jgi:molecular chaperone Hsp33
MSSSYILRGTAANHTLRILATDSSTLVSETKRRHELTPDASAALGRLMTGAVLFGLTLSKHEKSRISIRVEGDGPLRYMVAEGTVSEELKGGHASARGYVGNSSAELPLRTSDGKLDVGALVGQGELAVTRLLENGEPYTSSVALQSGEIADDLAYYLAVSEQIPSAVLLGVYLEHGEVHTAGGLLVQVMPGADDEQVEHLERNIAALGNITTALRNMSLLELVQRVTEGLGLELLEESLPLSFACRCSRERLLSTLTYFSLEERKDMMAQGGQEAVCHWCNTHYHLTPQEIEGLDDDMNGEQSEIPKSTGVQA